jgi:hypothetical protein
VDCWPMAIIIQDIWGQAQANNRLYGVIGRRYPPPEGCMLYSGIAFSSALPFVQWTIPWGTQWGQLDNLVGTSGSHCSWDLKVGDCLLVSSCLETTLPLF